MDEPSCYKGSTPAQIRAFYMTSTVPREAARTGKTSFSSSTCMRFPSPRPYCRQYSSILCQETFRAHRTASDNGSTSRLRLCKVDSSARIYATRQRGCA